MPYDQLLLPLLGGYFFIRRFNGTAYRCAAYSGTQLLLGSAFFGVFLALLATALIALLQESKASLVLHNLVVAPAFVGLLLLAFGAWKTAKALRKPAAEYETDDAGEFDARERNRKIQRGASFIFFGLALIGIAMGLVHAARNNPFIHLREYSVSVAVWVFLALWSIYYVKQRSNFHGYQLALRLGSVAVAGCVVFLGAYTMQDSVSELWNKFIPFEYAGTALLAMLLGIALVLPSNILFPYHSAIRRLFENGVLDGIESLFYYAGITFQLVMITLKDNKVYIGYIEGEIPISGYTDEFVTIIPIASGIRHDSAKTLELTTFYIDPFQKAIEKSECDLETRDMAKVIPLAEINSAGVFDPDLYQEFQESN